VDFTTPSLIFLAIFIAYYIGYMLGGNNVSKATAKHMRGEFEKEIKDQKAGWAKIASELTDARAHVDRIMEAHSAEVEVLEAQRDSAAEYVTAKALVVLERHGIGPPEMPPIDRLIREFTRMRKGLVNLARLREYTIERPEYKFDEPYLEVCIAEANKGLDWETIYPDEEA
jgi:hypothetical protein